MANAWSGILRYSMSDGHAMSARQPSRHQHILSASNATTQDVKSVHAYHEKRTRGRVRYWKPSLHLRKKFVQYQKYCESTEKRGNGFDIHATIVMPSSRTSTRVRLAAMGGVKDARGTRELHRPNPSTAIADIL